MSPSPPPNRFCRLSLHFTCDLDIWVTKPCLDKGIDSQVDPLFSYLPVFIYFFFSFLILTPTGKKFVLLPSLLDKKELVSVYKISLFSYQLLAGMFYFVRCGNKCYRGKM